MEKIKTYNGKCPTQWTMQDLKDAMINKPSEKQKNHINKQKYEKSQK
jgi:hypothetical protein